MEPGRSRISENAVRCDLRSIGISCTEVGAQRQDQMHSMDACR